MDFEDDAFDYGQARFDDLFKRYRDLLQRSYPDSTLDFDKSNLTQQLKSQRKSIARGGYSDVYRATLNDGTRVAVKYVRFAPYSPHREREYESAILRFFREMNIWYGLDHVNIAQLLGFTLENQEFGLVSRWYINGNVVNYLETHPEASRPDLMLDVAEGVGYLHTRGLVHANLRGVNILVAESGIACISDFGISKKIADMTRHTGFTTGFRLDWDRRWVAPEQITFDSPLTLASDVYSFGGVMMEIYCPGKSPFYYLSGDMRLIQAKVQGTLPDRTQYPELRDQNVLWDLIVACFVNDHRERPSMTILTDGLYKVFGLSPRALLSTSPRKANKVTSTQATAQMAFSDDTSSDDDNDVEMFNKIFKACQTTHRISYPESPIDFATMDLSSRMKPLGKNIGRGGFADVYRGVLDDDIRVAVKVLRLVSYSSMSRKEFENTILRFFRELNYWHGLDHVNIARLLGFTLANGMIGLVSVWYPRGNVVEYLKTHPQARKPDLILDVAEGVEYLHTHPQPLAHADLKGANILVTKGGVACLADFGISKRIHDEGRRTGFTTGNGPVGTGRWMAPEQFEDLPLTLASDVYSFAGVIIEIYCPGRFPFDYLTNDIQVIRAKCDGKIPERARYPELLHQDTLWGLIFDCFSLKPEQRPSITAVKQELYEEFCLSPRAPSSTLPRLDSGLVSRREVKLRYPPANSLQAPSDVRLRENTSHSPTPQLLQPILKPMDSRDNMLKRDPRPSMLCASSQQIVGSQASSSTSPTPSAILQHPGGRHRANKDPLVPVLPLHEASQGLTTGKNAQQTPFGPTAAPLPSQLPHRSPIPMQFSPPGTLQNPTSSNPGEDSNTGQYGNLDEQPRGPFDKETNLPGLNGTQIAPKRSRFARIFGCC